MNLKGIAELIIRQFFPCFFFTMAATVLLCSISSPPVTEITVKFTGQMMLFSLNAVLLDVVFYSPHGLSEQQYRIRNVIHTVLLVIVLMIWGYVLEMYEGFGQAFLFLLIILCVDFILRLLTFLRDRADAIKINNALKERRTK